LVIYTCSFAVSTVSGLPIQGVLVVVGLLGTLYTVIGGIRAVMLTDVVQFVVLIGGAILTIVVVAIKCGGPLAWWPDWSSPALADLDWPKAQLFSLDPNVRLSVVSVIIYGCSYWIMTATGDQVVIQRFLSTRDAKQARWSFGISMLGDLCTSLVLFFAGMALVGFFLQFPEELPDTALGLTAQADALFPHFIVAALFAAAMSSLDSGINSISTVLITDFPNTFTRGCADDMQRLARARTIGLFVGAIGIAMSFAVSLVPGNNLLEITVRVSSLLAAPLFVTFALAFFTKNSTPAGAWAGILVGGTLSILMTFWEKIIFFLSGAESSFSFTFIMPASALCAFAAGVVVSRFTKPRSKESTP
jgi:solute:Na+ symporter, SSS family